MTRGKGKNVVEAEGSGRENIKRKLNRPCFSTPKHRHATVDPGILEGQVKIVEMPTIHRLVEGNEGRLYALEEITENVVPPVRRLYVESRERTSTHVEDLQQEIRDLKESMRLLTEKTDESMRLLTEKTDVSLATTADKEIRVLFKAVIVALRSTFRLSMELLRQNCARDDWRSAAAQRRLVGRLSNGATFLITEEILQFVGEMHSEYKIISSSTIHRSCPRNIAFAVNAACAFPEAPRRYELARSVFHSIFAMEAAEVVEASAAQRLPIFLQTEIHD